MQLLSVAVVQINFNPLWFQLIFPVGANAFPGSDGNWWGQGFPQLYYGLSRSRK